jgi:hypothetical protein
MEDFDLETYKHWYASAWKGVLSHLLHWEPAAIDRWLASRTAILDYESTYHETPVYDVIPHVRPRALRDALDVAELHKLDFLIQKAFLDCQCVWPGEEGYNWAIAREKINIILAEYGHSLP